MKYCKDCESPCSYKEENTTGICPFKGDPVRDDQDHIYPTKDACCPMFKNYSIFSGTVWCCDDPITIPGNLYFGEDFFGDISTVKVSGDFIIDGEVNTMSLEIGGNLIVNGILDTNYEDITVFGDLIVTGTIRTNKSQKIFVQGEIVI